MDLCKKELSYTHKLAKQIVSISYEEGYDNLTNDLLIQRLDIDTEEFYSYFHSKKDAVESSLFLMVYEYFDLLTALDDESLPANIRLDNFVLNTFNSLVWRNDVFLKLNDPSNKFMLDLILEGSSIVLPSLLIPIIISGNIEGTFNVINPLTTARDIVLASSFMYKKDFLNSSNKLSNSQLCEFKDYIQSTLKSSVDLFSFIKIQD